MACLLQLQDYVSANTAPLHLPRNFGRAAGLCRGAVGRRYGMTQRD